MPRRPFPGFLQALAGAGVLAALGLAACTEPAPEARPPGLQPMVFRIDSTRIGARQEDPNLGRSFHAPDGWVRLTDAALDTVRALLPDTAAAYRYVFADPAYGSVLSIHALPDSAALSVLADSLGARLAARFPADTLLRDAYEKDSLEVVQFLVRPEGRVTFELIIAPDEVRRATFAYIVPLAWYPRAVRAVESSIGSIRRYR
ncbi:MAG: hypothetical protein R3247_13020 [Rhodothermales bacterium]|nr:hypothetical protein [Rhodothermales bacterium]